MSSRNQNRTHHVGKRVPGKVPSRNDNKCKTCSWCRSKKVKCDGERPQCRACADNDQECMYPQDARRDGRASSAKMQHLEANLALLWQHLKSSRILTASGELPEAQGLLENPAVEEQPIASSPVLWSTSPTSNATPQWRQPVEAQPQSTESNMTSCEARVAGVCQQDDQVSVHGLASILNPNTPPAPVDPNKKPQEAPEREAIQAAIRARLVSNAALQRQRESCVYKEPRNTFEYDGVDPELAKHLLDLHWNRTYFVTYRPAVMESLANGGPWANKLLLNAIYYSSSYLSDREGVRPNPHSTQSAGDRFYSRFKVLLGEEIVRPSIASATAILLCGTTLMSTGRSSAAWTLCGAAYRMIIDLGAHLIPEPNDNGIASKRLRKDIEQETRKRLYWAAYITDATQSLYLGRSPTLLLTEARVPQLFLDTYEEMEEWAPYLDHANPSANDTILSSYDPKPAYAVSTFKARARLFQISSQISKNFYSIECIKMSTPELKALRAASEEQLFKWKETLPPYLRFDPDLGPVPPPHQFTLHTTFHALNIILQRPWLGEGHMRRRSDPSEKAEGEQICIQHALSISKYVDAYRRTFTLRKAPFLLSYAIYSAVIVILKHGKERRGELRSTLSFFWTALSELQRGCNMGLKKPLAVLRDLMKEVGEMEPPIPNAEAADDPLARMLGGLTDSSMIDEGTSPSFSLDGFGFDPDDTVGLDFMDFLDDQEQTISHDEIYGLFAP